MLHFINSGSHLVFIKKVCRTRSVLFQRVMVLAITFALLFGLSRFNYILFHSLAQVCIVVITGAVFIHSWNSRQYIRFSYFTILGLGYLAVSILDFLHTFTFPGLNILPDTKTDAVIQLWVAARLVESLSFLIALAFVRRKLSSFLLPSVSITIALMVAVTILVWPLFPTCYSPEQGSTLFKIVSECIIIAILMTTLYLLHRNRRAFEPGVWCLVTAAVGVTICAELFFALSSTVDGVLIAVGHCLGFISICLIYLAIIESGLIQPYHLVTNALKQKKADEIEVNRSLLESEAKFCLLAEKSEGVFWVASADLERVLYVSPGYEKISLRPCEDVYADPSSLVNYIHPEDRQRVVRMIKSSLQDGWEIGFRLIRPDGSIRWIKDHGYPVADERGNIIQVCGMANDITKQKKLEQRLLQAGQTLEQRVATRTKAFSIAIGHLKEQVRERSKIGKELKARNIMLKTLVQAIPDMVSYKDLQGRYLITNSAHRAFFGLKGKSITGKTNRELKPGNEDKKNINRDRIVKKTRKPRRFESVMRSADGCTSHWDIRKVPVKDGNGKILGILSLSRDISVFKQREFQLQQSEAMLQAFLNGISEPMLMMDNNLNVVFLNRAASKAFSIDMQTCKVYTCANVICESKGHCEACRVRLVMNRKKAATYERRKPDSDRMEKVYLYPLSKEKNGLDGVVVRIADITEAKAFERHLIHSEKMNALGLLVAGMVHEINNPNSFISFNLPILRAYLEKIFLMLDSHPVAIGNIDWFGMEYKAFRHEIFNLTDNMAHGSSRIDNIVSNLKPMTHPKQICDQRKWVDLFDVLDKAVILCRSEIRKRVKVFEVQPPKQGIRIKTEPDALEQVIINLLINASHAADKNNSWVRIEAFLSEDLLNHAIIEVSDNGCGMSDDTMARIFDPFFTTKSPGVGTGLGLSVSYNLIRQLGGEILVDSKPEEGSLFKIVMPLEAESETGFEAGQESVFNLRAVYDHPHHQDVGNDIYKYSY